MGLLCVKHKSVAPWMKSLNFAWIPVKWLNLMMPNASLVKYYFVQINF